MASILGLIMIYNEEDFIQMYLKNVEHLVDHVLIMDGGSTDSTIDIINNVKKYYSLPIELVIDKQSGEDYNDPLYNHQERRNKLIKYAEGKCDYIFQMDVDESILETTDLHELIKSGKIVYTFPRQDFCWHPEYYRFHKQGRQPWLYKNDIGIEYSNENPPHEPLVYKGVNLLQVGDREDTDILIYHWHYCWGRKAIRDYFVEPPTWEEFERRIPLAMREEITLKRWEGVLPKVYSEFMMGRRPISVD